MRSINILAVTLVAALCFAVAPPRSQAQVSFSIGVAPACPYGYYDYSPYQCAPYGYYGPEWFSSGVFVGAGPWFHGPRDFHGHVDNHFDPHHGYHGHYPEHGEHANAHNDVHHMNNFHGNEERAEHGHQDGHGGHNGH